MPTINIINEYIKKHILTKLTRKFKLWKETYRIKNYRCTLFLKNNYFTLTLILIYLSFKQTFEELFETLITTPILSKFSVNIFTSIIFIAISIFLLYKIIQKSKHEEKVSDKTIGVFSFILIIYIYYRYTTKTAFNLIFPSFLCYVDIIPLICLYYCINIFRKHKNKNGDISNNGFLIDEPISKEENDLLNRNVIAKDAINKLIATNPKYEAFTFGIIAKWGEGKTSFMNLMKEYLIKDYKNDCVIMNFNPWIYSKRSDLTHTFLNELSNKLSSYNTMLSNRIEKYADLISVVDNNGIKTIAKLFCLTVNKTTSEQFEELKECMKNIGKKFFVFIDDIDRLNCSEMEEIFCLVRNTSSLPNMYFILAYDKNYVIDILKNQYKNHSLKYPEKIMQEEYELPKANHEILKNLLLLNLRKSLNDQDYSQIQNFLTKKTPYGINPMHFIKSIRTVKRIINQMTFSQRELHGEIDICDYFILELFRQQYKPIVNLLEKNMYEILIIQRQKYVYYNGKNLSDKEKNNIEKGITDKRIINIIEYITEYKNEFHINDSDLSDITAFLNSLFGEYKTCNIKSINNPNYIQRYFRYYLLESEVKETEWDELKKLTFEEMKPTIKEWMTNKSISLLIRIEKEEEKINNKEDIYKLLHLMFYTGSLYEDQITNYKFINTLLEMLKSKFNSNDQYTDEDRNEMRMCLNENGANFYQMRYLFSLFDHGSYNNDNILKKDEVIGMQNNILEQYISDGHSMRDILACWRDTAYQEGVLASDGKRYIEYKHTEKSRVLMKSYAENNIEDFVQEIITYFRPNTDSQYAINQNASYIWGNWSNFYDYIMKLNNDSPIISEFKDFLTKFKESEYASYVHFNFKNIILEDIKR